MKKLNIFIIKSFTGPFLVSFFIAMFFLVMQFFWKYVDDLMGKGLEISVLLELLFYVSAILIPLALPLAVLFSSIMTFGNLSEKNELTALKSSGLSLFRIMRPMLIFIVILSASAFYFSNYIMPIANLKCRTIIYNIQQKKPSFGIKEGVFYNDFEGYSIKVEDKNDNTGELFNVLIYQNESKGKGKTIIAERGEMLKSTDKNGEKSSFLLLKLVNGSIYQQMEQSFKNKKGAPYQKSFFEEAIIKFDLSGFDMQEESEDLFKRDYEMMNFVQLGDAIDSLAIVNDSLKNSFQVTMKRQVLVINPDYKKLNHTDTTKDKGILPQEPIDTLLTLEDLKEMEYKAALVAAQGKMRATKDLVHSQQTIKEFRTLSFNEYLASWHQKFTLSFSILILFFIGAPLGAIIKKGGLGAPLVFATLFFLMYYILMISGENMAESQIIEVWQGMWLSVVCLTPIGIFLTYKAANDSAIFDRDAYKKLLNKLLRKA